MIILKHYRIIMLLLLFSSILWGKTENYLRKTTLLDNTLTLTFKYNIRSVNFMTMKGHGVIKYVYDIKGGSLPLHKNISKYKHRSIKAFRIGQYSKTKLRVVLESFSSIEGKKYKVNGKSLLIYLPSPSKKNKHKTLKKKKPSVQKSIKQSQKNSRKRKRTRRGKKRQSYKGFSTNKPIRYLRSRRNKTIIIDAGHGGKDIGASSGRILEKNITLGVARKLRNVLKKMGYRVYMTRNSDRFLKLRERTAYANRKKGTLFISIHANAAPVRKPKSNYQGIEIFYTNHLSFKRLKGRLRYRGQKYCNYKSYLRMMGKNKTTKSSRLARNIKSNLLSHVKRKYRIYDQGVKRNDFWVLLATKMPSVLIETGYLTHKREVKQLTNSRYQKRLAEGIAHGINAYFR